MALYRNRSGFLGRELQDAEGRARAESRAYSKRLRTDPAAMAAFERATGGVVHFSGDKIVYQSVNTAAFLRE